MNRRAMAMNALRKKGPLGGRNEGRPYGPVPKGPIRGKVMPGMKAKRIVGDTGSIRSIGLGRGKGSERRYLKGPYEGASPGLGRKRRGRWRKPA